jgi:hypothetical protein
MSNSYTRSSASIACEIANLGVIRLRANASLYVINSKALYAKAFKLNLQAFVYK